MVWLAVSDINVMTGSANNLFFLLLDGGQVVFEHHILTWLKDFLWVLFFGLFQYRICIFDHFLYRREGATGSVGLGEVRAHGEETDGLEGGG